MRTTLTIDTDLAEQLRGRMAQKKLSLKRVVNEALRAGLARVDSETQVTFSVEPHPCRFKAGIDLDKMNQLVDELEAEASLRSLSR